MNFNFKINKARNFLCIDQISSWTLLLLHIYVLYKIIQLDFTPLNIIALFWSEVALIFLFSLFKFCLSPILVMSKFSIEMFKDYFNAWKKYSTVKKILIIPFYIIFLFFICILTFCYSFTSFLPVLFIGVKFGAYLFLLGIGMFSLLGAQSLTSINEAFHPENISILKLLSISYLIELLVFFVIKGEYKLLIEKIDFKYYMKTLFAPYVRSIYLYVVVMVAVLVKTYLPNLDQSSFVIYLIYAVRLASESYFIVQERKLLRKT